MIPFDESESYSPEDRLNELQEFIFANYDGAREKWRKSGLGSRINEVDPLEDLRSFSQAVFSGQMPDPKVLVRIAVGFDKYLNQTEKGGLSLDDALNLSREKKTGTPALRAYRRGISNALFYEIFTLRIGIKKITIEKAVAQVHDDKKPHISRDSLVTRYKKSSWRKCEDATRKEGFSFRNY